MENKQGNPFAVAALVLGIVSLVFSFLYVWIGLITGIVGIVMAVMSRKNPEKKGLGTAGLVCSIIGTVLSGIFVACALCVIGAANEIVTNLNTLQ